MHTARWLRACMMLLVILYTATAEGADRPMTFARLMLDDGLSQNTVMSVLQDRQGFMWFATENGLNRWDGYRMQQYRRSDAAGALVDDFVWVVAEDAKGDLWLATASGGIARWNRATDSFTSFRHREGDKNSIASNKVRTLLFDKRGHLWIGTLDAGLDEFVPETGQFIHHGALVAADGGSTVYALMLDRDDALWVGTDAGLSRLSLVSSEQKHFAHADGEALCGNAVRSIVETGDGQLWVGTFGGGVCRLIDKTQGLFETFAHDPAASDSLSDNDVRALFEDQSGQFWIGTANGLNLFDRQTRRFVRYGREDYEGSLSDSYVMSLYQDRGGLLWVGTRSGGVNAWNARSWSFGHFRPAWSIDTNITSFAQTPGSMWIGTMGRGLVRVRDRDPQPEFITAKSKAPFSLPDDRVMALAAGANRELWVGTMTGGLLRLDPARGTKPEHYRHVDGEPGSLPANGVMSLLLDRAGGLWVGTYGGGVARLAPGATTFQTFGADAPGFSRALATALAEDGNHGIWVGTDRGLYLVDALRNQVYRFVHDHAKADSIGADSIYDLYVDPAGMLWIGTSGGGLNRMLGSSLHPEAIRFATVNRANGLASDVVYGIEGDENGMLWISGNSGLSRYSLRNGEMQTFHRNHGLQSEEFNFGAHFRSADGRLWFGGSNGYNAFWPARLQVNTREPPLVMTRFEKLDRAADLGVPYALMRTVNLAYDERMFTFEFAALDFTASKQNRYQYFLEGFDPQWIDAGNSHRATYTNLDAGAYRFRVRAANSDGTWNRDGIVVDVNVAPAPWRTWQAYALYALALLFASSLAVNAYRRRQREKATYLARLEHEVQARTLELNQSNEELKRVAAARGEFVARMSHELRTPMNGVLGMSELLGHSALDARQSRLVATIRASATSLLSIINDILDFSKLEANRLVLERIEFDLEALANEVVESLAVDAQRKGVEMVCKQPRAALPHVIGDPLRLRQVLANLIGNAVKFTDFGAVTLELVRGKQSDDDSESAVIVFNVRDTGCGIGAESLDRIFESFTQEQASTARRYGGTGLGLSIARQIVHLMGGELRVTSELGVGSTFSFALALPVAASAPEALGFTNTLGAAKVIVSISNTEMAGAVEEYLNGYELEVARVDLARLGGAAVSAQTSLIVASVDSEVDLQRLNNAAMGTRHGGIALARLDSSYSPTANTTVIYRPVTRTALCAAVEQRVTGGVSRRSESVIEQRLCGRVLVIEDNPVNQEVVLGMLEQLGVNGEAVSTGEAALERLAAGGFDLVLMDCNLPTISGYETTRAIRLAEARRRVPAVVVVAFTANGIEQRQRCVDAGMNDVLAKPTTLRLLRDTLSRYLRMADRTPMPELATDEPTALVDESVLARLRGLRRKGVDDMLGHVIGLYRQHSAELIASMRAALARTEVAEVGRLAHTLKSSSANVGAMSLATLCGTLEQLASEITLERAAETVDEIAALHTQVMAQLERETQGASVALATSRR